MKGANNPDPNGEEVQIKDYLDARNISEEEVIRRVEMSSGEAMMTAYRDDDQHVILIETEDGEIMEKQIAAERGHTIPGQTLWTIPDNWEVAFEIDEPVIDDRGEPIYHKIYRIDPPLGSDMALYYDLPSGKAPLAMVGSLAGGKTDTPADLYYFVEEVGVGSISPYIASQSEVEDALDDIRQKQKEDYGDVKEYEEEVLERIKNNWDVIEDAMEDNIDRVYEWLPLRDGNASILHYNHDAEELVCPLSENESYCDRVMDAPGNDGLYGYSRKFQDAKDIDGRYDDKRSLFEGDVFQLLDDRGILSPDAVYFEIDESGLIMDYYIRALVEWGCSAAEALDYYYVEVDGVTQTKQAERRGVGQDTISRNVAAAKDEIDHVESIV